MRPARHHFAALALLALPTVALADQAPEQTATPRAEQPSAHLLDDEWKLQLYVDGYLSLGEEGTSAWVAPTVFMDHGALHLELRANYEEFNTGSMFAGYTFRLGDEETYLKLTPMLGAALGLSFGLAPALEVEARWWRLAYWLELEYYFSFTDPSASFLYAWSELNLYATDFLWFGASVQRLRLARTEREVDFGPMVGVKAGPLTLSFYFYGLFTPTRLSLLTLSVPIPYAP